MMEPPFTRLSPLLEAFADNLVPHLTMSFTFFGHSMGALISFEITRYLRVHGGATPLQLFVSGHRAPQLIDCRRLTSPKEGMIHFYLDKHNRFHLACNGSAVLKYVLARHPVALRKVTEPEGTPSQSTMQPPAPVGDAAVVRELADPRRTYWRTRYDEVLMLHRAGWLITAIAERMGLCRPTVHIYV